MHRNPIVRLPRAAPGPPALAHPASRPRPHLARRRAPFPGRGQSGRGPV